MPFQSWRPTLSTALRATSAGTATVIDSLSSSVTIAVSGALAWGGANRLCHVGAFRSVLAASWIVPSGAPRSAPLIVGGGELLLGGALLAGAPGAAVAAAAVLVLLSLVSLLGQRRSAEASCGCLSLSGAQRVGRTTHIRNLLLLSGSMVLILSPTPPEMGWISLVAGTILCASLILADAYYTVQQAWERTYSRPGEPLP